MSLRERFYKIVDAPMTWTRAILLGTGVWLYSIIFMGQIPSLIIYKADQYVAEIIDFTTKIPFVNDEGLNTQQIKIIRDIIANGFQINALIVLLVVMYQWQKRKQKRTGAKSIEDPVKGYMPGK
ncbi:MAG: hypothetical protein ACRDLB_15965 [Actinomycetota bacterium]